VILEIIRDTPGIISVIDEIAVDPQAFKHPIFPEVWLVTPREETTEFIPTPQEP
jgi:hypothetical protein